MLKEFAPIVAFFLAGMALGVMLMAVLQRYGQRRKTTDTLRSSHWSRDRLGNRIGGAMPERRYNGRCPQDAERRP
jgi:hypothetical protein